MRQGCFSKLGILFVLLYWTGILVTWLFVRTCTDTYCGLAIIFPFAPWIILFDSFVSSDFAFIALGIYGLLNTILAYLCGWGLRWAGRRIFKSSGT